MIRVSESKVDSTWKMPKTKLKSGENSKGVWAVRWTASGPREKKDGRHQEKRKNRMNWARKDTVPGHPAHHIFPVEGHAPTTKHTGKMGSRGSSNVTTCSCLPFLPLPRAVPLSPTNTNPYLLSQGVTHKGPGCLEEPSDRRP